MKIWKEEKDSKTCEFCDKRFYSEQFIEFHIRREHVLKDWK